MSPSAVSEAAEGRFWAQLYSLGGADMTVSIFLGH